MSAAATIDPAELAAALIARPSVTPKDEGALPYLASVLEKLGFACELQEFSEPGTEPVLNLYARRGRAGRNFCFAGHTDVVPPGPRESWTSDPFQPARKDGMLYGRGAADMKGAIACFVAAVERFLTARADFAGSISFLVTGDEEGVSINGTKKLLDWLASRGEKLDACIVGEPTNIQTLGDMIKIGRRGSMNATLTVQGTQGHTAYPHLADNAAHRLVKMLGVLLDETLDRGSAHFQPSTLEISTIDIGNPATNVIPGKARAVFNIRFNDTWSSARVTEWLRKKLDPLGGRYELAIQVSGESFLVPPGEVSELLTGAIKRVTGRVPELSTTGGTSDARFIHRFCPLAEFGLVGLTMHKANECVALADLTALTEIYRLVLEGYFPAP
jgi:succinyl-diaminopimelate desuccinylase